MISTIRSLCPERIAFSSAVCFFTAAASSSDRGSMSLVSVGSGSFRLNSILTVFHSPSGMTSLCRQLFSASDSTSAAVYRPTTFIIGQTPFRALSIR